MESPTFVHPPVVLQTFDPDRVIRIRLSAEYPKQLWYLIASFVALVSICHGCSLVMNRNRRPRVHAKSERLSLYRLPLAVANVFRVLAFRYTIPIGRYYTLNIAEVFLTAAYLAALFTWSLINTTNTKGLRFDPKYYSNRAAHIAATQTNLMVGLAMKNNIFSFLTGVSFDKLNYLHRVVARTSMVLVWVHAAGRWDLGFSGEVSMVHSWMRAGVMAGVAITILSFIAVRPIRESNYEIFKILHLVTGVIYIIGSYFHSVETGAFGPYIWPAILLWALDRCLRFLRIILFTASPNCASIDVLSPHFLRLIVDKPKLLRWRPGQSVYITLPEISFWQSHPFTISYESDGKLMFFIRVRDGFSKHMLQNATSAKFGVWIDGPYSSPPVTKGCDGIVLIAGGSGVAFTLPLLIDAITNAKKTGAPYPRITFIWAIRETSHAQWINQPLLEALRDLPDGLYLKIEIYVTDTAGVQESEGREWDDDSPSPEETAEKASGSGDLKEIEPAVRDIVSIIAGTRPNLKQLLGTELTDASLGTLSINVCGTLALSNAVRDSLRDTRFLDILRGGPTVLLHVEAFGTV